MPEIGTVQLVLPLGLFGEVRNEELLVIGTLYVSSVILSEHD